MCGKEKGLVAVRNGEHVGVHDVWMDLAGER